MANIAVDADVKSGGISRREFLYYIWGASLALFTAQFAGLLIWFLIPKFREGEFGGRFIMSIDDVPPVNAVPNNIPEGRFWLVKLDTSDPDEDGQKRMYQASDEPDVRVLPQSIKFVRIWAVFMRGHQPTSGLNVHAMVQNIG